MGELYIPRHVQEALAAVNTSELAELVGRAIREERSGVLTNLRLANCGIYIGRQLDVFEKALSRHREAKSVKKRSETEYSLNRAGHDLIFAVESMKDRMALELSERELFNIEEYFLPPTRFTKQLSVRVGFRWRRSVEDDWLAGSITFNYEVDLTPDYPMPRPAGKVSTAKKEKDLQEKLYGEWEHLKRNALYSVRDYFRGGGNGGDIPPVYAIKSGNNSRGLNNFSTQFWRTEEST